MSAPARPEVLLIGGGAGTRKTSVAAELHLRLAARRVRHALAEGDTLDQAWPVPWQQGLHLAEAHLAAIWRTYRAAGWSRLVYTISVSVQPDVIASLVEVLGDAPVVHGVLLRASEATVAARLGGRETESGLEAHLDSSRRLSAALEASASAWVRRATTDGRTVTEIAAELGVLPGWPPDPPA